MTERLGTMKRMVTCISDVWMSSDRLQLNTAKTEALWCASSRQQHIIPNARCMRVCADHIKPGNYVRDLGIHIDSDMSIKTYVSRTASSCFAIASLRHIRSIRRCVSKPVLMSLVSAMVLSRLDHGSVTLNGITTRLMNRLQSVLSAAATLVCNSHKYDRISPLLRDLHWLRFPKRIKFRFAVLVFHCRN